MKIEGVLLDVEGVLVADKRYEAVPGAAAFVERMRALGLPLRLITNNTTDTRPAMIEKLTGAGFDFTIDELHTCTQAAVTRLRTLAATRCMVLGTLPLQQIFREAGFEVAEASDVQAVVVGLDTGLTYEKLRLACDAVRRSGAMFIALHRNRLFPDSQGRVSPSVGAVVEAIRYATQVEPIVIGKPSREYFQLALDELNAAAETVLVVSDDPLTDLAGAKRMGMKAAFVLSGKYTDGSVLDQLPARERPDITCASLGELLSCEAFES